MSNCAKKLIIFTSFTISFILISYLWNNISFPLKNTNQTVGFLTVKNLNPFNDTIRYILIIGIPLSVYFFLKILFLKKKIKLNFLFQIFDYKIEEKNLDYKEVKYYFLLLILLIFIQFISFDHTYKKLDYLHDGDYLTPAFNFFNGNGIWSSAFTSHGGSDIFYASLAWKLFNNISIGSVKVFMSIYIITLKIISIFFVFKLMHLSNLNLNGKKFFFVILSIIVLSFSNFQFPMNYSIISYRDLYYLLFFIFLIDFIYKRSSASFWLLPIISFFTPLMHIDTGVYLTLLFFLVLFYLLVLKEFKSFIKISSIYIMLWISLIIFVGLFEFLSFFNHLIYMIKYVDLVHGLQHPQPIFSIGNNEHGFRGTKGLALQLLACVIVVREIFFKKNRSNKDKILLIFLIFMSIIAYKNALGRSDAQHIRMSSDFPLIILSFFIIEYFLKLLQKPKKIRLQLINKTSYLIILFIFLVSVVNFDYKNINKNKSFISSIYNDDYNFLDQDSKEFIKISDNYFKKENCIFNFTTDISFPYFIKKKTCNKYFSPWLISGTKLENKYIDDLKNIEHRYILYSSPKYSPDGISTKNRLKLVNKFLLKNYKKVYSKNGFEILEKLY